MLRLLILGGSNCQINAFRRAKTHGISTILFDYLPHPPAAALAETHVQVSTFDVEGCVREASSLRPDGVMTLGTDQPVYTAARVAEALGLPHLIGVDTALAVTNKAVMKGRMAENGIPAVPWRLLAKAEPEDAELTFPLVMKPLDSQGQKGVFRVRNREEFRALFDVSLSFSRCDRLLIEDYYDSHELTVSAWCENGVARVLTVTDRVTFDEARHIGICTSHRYPSVHAAGREREIDALTQRLAEAFSIRGGPLYVQLLVGEKGLVVNELACRIGGAFEDVFIPLLTGFDILGAVMDAALGRKIFQRPAPEGPLAGSVRELMLFGRPGVIGKITPLEEILALPFVADAGYAAAAGDAVSPLQNAGERLGHAVLSARDESEMRRHLDTFYETFCLADASGADMLLRREC